jgi:hypothetical protein
MTENKEPVEIRSIIKIEGKTYDVKSVTEAGAQIIGNIQKIDGVLSQKQLEINIINIAKAKLVDELVKEAQNFQEVQPDQAKEVP